MNFKNWWEKYTKNTSRWSVNIHGQPNKFDSRLGWKNCKKEVLEIIEDSAGKCLARKDFVKYLKQQINNL